MGRKDVRTAVAAYFNSGVTNLRQVKRAKPRNVEAGVFDLTTAHPSAAIGWVYIEGEHEQRIAVPRVDGIKQVTYGIGLRIDFRSVLSNTESAIDDYDDIIEGVKAHLRADPTLGTGPDGVVFQAGEGDNFGAPDVEVIADEPKETGNTTTTILSVVRFALTEHITA